MKVYLVVLLLFSNLMSLLLLFLVKHDCKKYMESQMWIVGQENKSLIKDRTLQITLVIYTAFVLLFAFLSYLFLIYGSPF